MKQTRYYLGHPEQMSGAEFFRRCSGTGEGMKVCRVRNGLGLECLIAADRCADLCEVSYMGQNIGFLSPCGHRTPDLNAPFLERFTAGFITTCGLNNVGSPCTDDGEELPLHGTISNTPCHNIYAQKTEEGICVRATVYDSRIFGRNLKLEREYFFSSEESSFLLTDTVCNLGETAEPIEILYHCNMGYPFLDEDAVLRIPSQKVTPRNAHAETGINNWNTVDCPTEGYEEMCFFHKLNGIACVALEQPKLNIGMKMEYSTDELPCFTQWKMMGQGQYVMGLEPGNCFPDGRAAQRARGNLQILSPGETATYRVKFTFYKPETENF